ncbi:MAG TPA: M14 family metallopeptidase [Blastocatellia bacterium]|nr:M14 family metallopeptidase [Blastocatellia bacterium]
MITRSRLFVVALLISIVASPLLTVSAQSSAPVALSHASINLEQDAKLLSVPAPRDVLGFEPGEDKKLAGWSQIVDYFKRLDAASARVSVHQPGLSTERRPFIIAIISSEENIENLSRIREAQRKLADPRLIASSQERERLIRETPAVVAITCSIHSTEIVASQMSMELAYRLASDNSDATKNLLRNVVLVLVPSVNPDGIDIVTNWYRKTLGTKYEGTSPPELYHHYTGHDNNRDWFMLTQVETQIVSNLFWREWFPEIVYDVHQQGQFGSRMCTPPFFDPSNPNIDPVILREVGTIGMKMAENLTAAGFKGVVTNSTYDTWWHGGLRTAPYYHNAVGILTEAASVRIATPMEIKREQLRSPTRGLANPLVAATNFPAVWEGGQWRMRDIMNMELITTRTMLEEAALHREDYIRNFVAAATRGIEAGKNEAPYAYIVPAGQHDQPTADKMINILIQQGVEVNRAKSDFTVDGKKYEKGSYVVLLAQPYRANVKCLFEAQHYPDRRIYPGGPAEQPYDVAGWTLPMTMGVDYVEAGKRFDAELEKINQDFFNLRLIVSGVDRARRFFLRSEQNVAFDFINQVSKSLNATAISRLKEPVIVNLKQYPAGTFLIEDKSPANPARPTRATHHDSKAPASSNSISSLAIMQGISLERVPDKELKTNLEGAANKLIQPRVALYRSWSPSMDEGWTRWILEQFSFDFKNIYDADVRAGNLKDKFDVIILPDQSMQQIINGNRAGSYPEEYTGGITEVGVAALRSFVEAGGVLICLDSASELAIKRFDLPVKNVLEGLRRDQFYAPGSIFRATVDTTNPIAYGMPEQADLYFVSGSRRGAEPDSEPTPAPRSQSTQRADAAPTDSQSERREQAALVSAFAFEITDPSRARSVARYIEGNPLRSGWLLGPQYIAGKSALVDVQMGKGRVVLIGFRTQHRAQTWGTFKFLFNSILLGGMKRD